MWCESEPIVHFGWLRENVANALSRYAKKIIIHQYGNLLQTNVVQYKGHLTPDQFSEVLRRYNVGLIDYPNSVENEKLCAPTKLFDYLKFGIMPVCLGSDHLLNYWFNELGVGCSLDQLIAGHPLPSKSKLLETYNDRRLKRINSLRQISVLMEME